MHFVVAYLALQITDVDGVTIYKCNVAHASTCQIAGG